ncbi:hypothetical protein C4F50_15945 [Flavobacterium sp. KB82]|uniref:Uncharacterized protein n=1 Tax=Flavobacterium hungaricum TaxID=2082725 RepID=A0ABR9TM30_9FLAO|nr:hypothetical protein [Flavobacterium hungaricum]
MKQLDFIEVPRWIGKAVYSPFIIEPVGLKKACKFWVLVMRHHPLVLVCSADFKLFHSGIANNGGYLGQN